MASVRKSSRTIALGARDLALHAYATEATLLALLDEEREEQDALRRGLDAGRSAFDLG